MDPWGMYGRREEGGSSGPSLKKRHETVVGCFVTSTVFCPMLGTSVNRG